MDKKSTAVQGNNQPSNDKTLNINTNAVVENKNNFYCCIYPRRKKNGAIKREVQSVSDNSFSGQESNKS